MERFSRQQKTATVVLSCLFVIAITLFVRRLSGAFGRELAPGEAVLDACLFASAAVASTWPLRVPAISDERFARSVAALILTLIFVAGLSSDPATVLACLASTAFIIGLSQRQVSSAAGQQSPGEAVAKPSDVGETNSIVALDEQPATSLSRVSLLRRTAGGFECVEGSMVVEFEAHELTKTLHVPLWPPLAAEPIVECRLEGIEGRVRVPLAKRHGFRMEVRLPEDCDEPLAGTLRFTAKAADRAAAA